MNHRSIVVAALAVLLPGLALAADQGVDAARGSFAEQRAAILIEMDRGDTYSEISQEDRNVVIAELDRMDGLLRGRGSDELNQKDKVALFNAQEVVNAKLTQASDDSRMVCRRERIPGSNLKTNLCSTVAARRRARERDRDALSELRRSQSDPNGAQ